MGNTSSVNNKCIENKLSFYDDNVKHEKSDVNQDNLFTLTTCKHKFEYKYLCKYITENVSFTIKCPKEECSQNISDANIRKFLSNFKIELYESLLMLSLEKTRKCLTINCPIIVSIEGENSAFHCTYCDQPNCFKCNKRHFPTECTHGDVTNENDIEMAAIRAMSIHKRQEIESQFKEENYIPNPESFECVLCTFFILPREGLMMRNCFHNFCKNCFEKGLKSCNFQCPMCSKEVNDRELIKARGGINEISLINHSMIRHKYFNCKYPDCSGFWDDNNCKGSFVCPTCHHSNCLDCKDIHEGMSCEAFRKTDRYKNNETVKKIIKEKKGINCICGKHLIREGGCGALYCSSCHKHICAFTGKKAGNTGADSCGCTSKNPCHADCQFGCIAE